MTFLLDENFPKGAEAVLTSRGHEVIDFRCTAMQGMSDADVFKTAQAAKAVLLTTDRDFFHTIPHLFDTHSGVVVVALRQPNRRNILAKLEWILDRIEPADFPNRVFQLRDNTWTAIPSLAEDI